METKEYGYIEDGYLRSRTLEPIVERYNDNGEVKNRVISIEEQIALLDPLWKPVDLINDDEMICDEENCMIRPIPYDAGDHISYRYDKIPDFQKVKNSIRSLKEQLTDDDYKVIKCYEASLVGEQLPYDIQELHTQRQTIREQINALETQEKRMMSL